MSAVGHVLCPACRRHVRVDEPRCPFCAGALPNERAPIPRATRRLARGAAFVFASSLASFAGCGGEVEDPARTTSDAGVDARSDGGTSDAATDAAADTLDDTGGVAPPYGLPADDAGGGMADYGAPPPPTDAG